MALLVWNLIEHCLRLYVQESSAALSGWDKKPTRRPTAFMMSSRFIGLMIVKVAEVRRLASSFTVVQDRYLTTLNLSKADLLNNHRLIKSS